MVLRVWGFEGCFKVKGCFFALVGKEEVLETEKPTYCTTSTVQ